MTDLSREILDSWQIRKTKDQKTAFIELLTSRLPDARVEKGGLSGSRNILVGDVAGAKLVLTAHYDTCAVLPFPNFLTPKNFLIYILYNLLIAFVMVALCLAAGYGAGRLFADPAVSMLAYFLVLILILFVLTGGRANKHTVNDNTSGVVTLLEIMAAMTPEQRAATAFVFFDNEESGMLGSGVFWKKHKAEMKDKLLVNLDCVSDGDNIMLVIKRRAEQSYGSALRESFTGSGEKTFLFEKAATTIYPSDQSHFPMALAIAAFRRSRVFGLYLSRIHTGRDTVFEEENVRLIRDGVLKLTEHL